MALAQDVMWLNPRRRKRRRNPEQYMLSNPEQYSLGNPNAGELFMSQIREGSDITQNISVLDVAVGSMSFIGNNATSKMLGLSGWYGIVASGIVPFITGGLLGMVHSRFGTAAFFGGQMDFASKLIGKLTQGNFGLVDDGSGKWVLATFQDNPLKLVGLAQAQRVYQLPASMISTTSQIPNRSGVREVKVM